MRISSSSSATATPAISPSAQPLFLPKRKVSCPSSAAAKDGPVGLGVALEEVEDAVPPRVQAGREGGPGDRRLRRDGRPQRREAPLRPQLREVRQLPLVHPLLGELGVRAVEAEDDQLLGRLRGERRRGERQRRPPGREARSRDRIFEVIGVKVTDIRNRGSSGDREGGILANRVPPPELAAYRMRDDLTMRRNPAPPLRCSRSPSAPWSSPAGSPWPGHGCPSGTPALPEQRFFVDRYRELARRAGARLAPGEPWVSFTGAATRTGLRRSVAPGRPQPAMRRRPLGGGLIVQVRQPASLAGSGDTTAAARHRLPPFRRALELCAGGAPGRRSRPRSGRARPPSRLRQEELIQLLLRPGERLGRSAAGGRDPAELPGQTRRSSVGGNRLPDLTARVPILGSRPPQRMLVLEPPPGEMVLIDAPARQHPTEGGGRRARVCRRSSSR